jgi:hypothetical protein
MSCAIALSATLTRPGWLTALAAGAVVAGAALAGGRLRPQIRRKPRLQLLAAGLLASLGIPVELAGGRHGGDALLDALAWASVFAAFTLGVWACTARSSRIRRSEARPLTVLSVVVPVAAAAGFAFAASHGRAAAALLSAVAMLAFAVWRPGAKQMKRVGLSLAACAIGVGVVLTAG